MVKRSLRKKSGGTYGPTGRKAGKKFTKLKDAYRTQGILYKKQDSEIKKLNRELQTCRGELQTCREELQTCRGELQACRKELDNCQEDLQDSLEDVDNCQKNLKECQTQRGLLMRKIYDSVKSYKKSKTFKPMKEETRRTMYG